MKPSTALLQWLRAVGAPVCVDPTWPSSVRSRAVTAAEDLLEIGAVARVDGAGLGLWVQLTAKASTATRRMAVAPEVLDAVLAAVPDDRGVTVRALRARTGVTQWVFGVALRRLEARGAVVTYDGRNRVRMVRRNNPPTSC